MNFSAPTTSLACLYIIWKSTYRLNSVGSEGGFGLTVSRSTVWARRQSRFFLTDTRMSFAESRSRFFPGKIKWFVDFVLSVCAFVRLDGRAMGWMDGWIIGWADRRRMDRRAYRQAGVRSDGCHKVLLRFLYLTTGIKLQWTFPSRTGA